MLTSLHCLFYRLSEEHYQIRRHVPPLPSETPQNGAGGKYLKHEWGHFHLGSLKMANVIFMKHFWEGIFQEKHYYVDESYKK